MNRKQSGGASDEESTFRSMASHYLVCHISDCPLSSRCLRYIVGRYADPSPVACLSVNPLNAGVRETPCRMFREKVRVVMKRGMTHFYYDMPGRKEHAIRYQFIEIFGRKQYYQMRRGDRLITPDEQEQIAAVCHAHGWTAPLVYDGEEEDWLW